MLSVSVCVCVACIKKGGTTSTAASKCKANKRTANEDYGRQDCRIAGAAVVAQAEAEAESVAGVGPPVSSLLLVAAFSTVMQFDAAQNRTNAHTLTVATHTHTPTHARTLAHMYSTLGEPRCLRA